MKKNILIAGLGNITKQYANTRHNFGFLCLNKLTNIINNNDIQNLELQLQRHSNTINWKLNNSLHCMIAELSINDFCCTLSQSHIFNVLKMNESDFYKHLSRLEYKIILVAPTTYINNSGECLKKILEKYDISQTIIIYDDIDTRFGCINFKLKGGNGGHNGLKSINALYNKDYLGLKLGIGANIFLNDYVYSLLSPENKNAIESLRILFYDIFNLKIKNDPLFKRKSFFNVMKEKIDSHILPICLTIIKNFNSFKKCGREDIVPFVLSDFNHYELHIIDSLLKYAAYSIIFYVFDWCFKDFYTFNTQNHNDNLIQSNKLSSLAINFK